MQSEHGRANYTGMGHFNQVLKTILGTYNTDLESKDNKSNHESRKGIAKGRSKTPKEAATT